MIDADRTLKARDRHIGVTPRTRIDQSIEKERAVPQSQPVRPANSNAVAVDTQQKGHSAEGHKVHHDYCGRHQAQREGNHAAFISKEFRDLPEGAIDEPTYVPCQDCD